VVVQTSPGVSNDNVTIEILDIPSSPPNLTAHRTATSQHGYRCIKREMSES
jgi:hypothetical protein